MISILREVNRGLERFIKLPKVDCLPRSSVRTQLTTPPVRDIQIRRRWTMCLSLKCSIHFGIFCGRGHGRSKWCGTNGSNFCPWTLLACQFLDVWPGAWFITPYANTLIFNMGIMILELYIMSHYPRFYTNWVGLRIKWHNESESISWDAQHLVGSRRSQYRFMIFALKMCTDSKLSANSRCSSCWVWLERHPVWNVNCLLEAHYYPGLFLEGHWCPLFGCLVGDARKGMWSRAGEGWK